MMMIIKRLFKERCWILTGFYSVSMNKRYCIAKVHPESKTVGTWGQVTSNWQWIYERQKSYRDVIGVLHTHPWFSSIMPSSIDQETSLAWSKALGIPWLCMISNGIVMQSNLFENGKFSQSAIPFHYIRIDNQNIYGMEFDV